MNALKRHEADIINFFVLTALFMLFTFIFWGKVGDLIIDNGREAYFPVEVLKGKVLYKDIFNIFGPLSYQINALFYGIWGVNLSVIYTAGIINAFIIMFTMYLISRTVTNPLNSLITCFMIMTACIFKLFIHNYIFPYSYAAVYAVSSFLLSVLFCIYYLIKSRSFLIVISFFFIGMSLAFKYEFLLFFIFLLVIIFFIKPLSKKVMLISFAAMLLPILISYGILFLQGLTVPEFISALQTIYKFATTKAYIKYLYDWEGIVPNFNVYKTAFPRFLYSMSIFIKVLLIFYFILLFISLIFKKNEKLKNCLIAALPTYYVIYVVLVYDLKYAIIFIYPFLGYVTTLILFAMLYYIKTKEFSQKEKIFLFLLITSLVAAAKSYFFLNMYGYGSYFVLLFTLVNIVFFIDYFPKFFKFIDAKIFQITFLSILISVAVFFIHRELKNLNFMTHPLKTKHGTIYTLENKGEVMDKLLCFIEKEVPENSKLLVIPEGILINFLADRETINKFYCLIPNHIETLGEENIVKELKTNFPDYIIINNLDTMQYGYTNFGRNYGKQIKKVILENYNFVKELKSKHFSNIYDPQNQHNDIIIKIYKKRNL